MGIICNRCYKHELMAVVNLQVQVPFGYSNLSKTGIRSRKAQILGVDWSRAVIYCPQCGRVRSEAEHGQDVELVPKQRLGSTTIDLIAKACRIEPLGQDSEEE